MILHTCRILSIPDKGALRALLPIPGSTSKRHEAAVRPLHPAGKNQFASIESSTRNYSSVQELHSVG